MRHLTGLRPTPALAISLIALFVSLGGVSYGLATGSIDSREIRNNTVRTQDIRNNQIRGRDVRNSTLGGADVARDRLKGADILESSLGRVPSAASADLANRASSADRASSAGAVDRLAISGSSVTGASVGQSPTLLTRGPFTIRLVCTSVGASPQAQITISSSESGGAVQSSDPGTDDPGFDNGETQPISDPVTSPGAAQATGANTYNAFAASGTAIVGQVYAAVNKNGAACVGGATAIG